MFYKNNINNYIDYSLLKPNLTVDEIRAGCRQAIHHHFAAVCIGPSHIEIAKPMLAGSDVALCSAVDFPYGAGMTEVRVFGALKAIEAGADEIDVVINIGMAKSGNFEAIYRDISAVVDAVHPRAILNVIIETAMLTDEEKINACKAIKRARADFVKTSTGTIAGANVRDVSLIRRAVGEDMKIKASGGITTLEQANELLQAGANRIGTSHALEITQKQI